MPFPLIARSGTEAAATLVQAERQIENIRRLRAVHEARVVQVNRSMHAFRRDTSWWYAWLTPELGDGEMEAKLYDAAVLPSRLLEKHERALQEILNYNRLHSVDAGSMLGLDSFEHAALTLDFTDVDRWCGVTPRCVHPDYRRTYARVLPSDPWDEADEAE